MNSSCAFKRFSCIKDLKAHLYEHAGKRESVKCPFCFSYSSNNKVTLSSHIRRKHEKQDVFSLRKEFLCDAGVQLSNDHSDNAHDIHTVEREEAVNLDLDETNISGEENENSEDEEDHSTGTGSSENEIFLRSIANTFNSWMNCKNIPYRTVQEIIGEFFENYDRGMALCKKRLQKKLI